MDQIHLEDSRQDISIGSASLLLLLIMYSLQFCSMVIRNWKSDPLDLYSLPLTGSEPICLCF